MLGWIFKKNTETTAAVAPQPTARGAAPADGQSQPTQAKESADAAAAWAAKLDAATGNDTALLEIARLAPSIMVKCAAVAALTHEAALKQAEREFRTHDRRVHRAAKQRHDAAVAQRVARERAARLIETATALLDETTIPTNRLVELDRSWQALDPSLLDDAQRTEFAGLSARLTELTRERGERELQTQRWVAGARQALAQLNAACVSAETGTGEPTELTRAVEVAQASCLNAPGDGSPAAALLTRLQESLQEAAQVEARLSLRQAEQLAQLQAQQQAQQPAPPPALPPAEPAARKASRQIAQRELAEAVAPLLQQAEAALAAGSLAETHAQLVAIDAATGGAAVPEAQRARLAALHAEYARLKGWQSWGGGRARDDLVQEAQTLATATAAAVADPQQAAKLPVKLLADAIDDLRKRWKELDRLGGATNQALWHSFDAALKTAFEPVAAHLEQLKARRKENLAARLQLIEALENAAAALPLEDTPDWRELTRALAHFQTEWRKLGPVEHTVPHKARDKLVERMQASVARIEAPLQEARNAAQHEREQLVARAQALRDEAAAHPHGRDLVTRVRELQEQWQQHARTLPLARQAENALWADFKAATDAVFTQRDAAYSARDAELLANQAAREALIARLEALTAQSPDAEIKRTLAEVDSQWRQAVDVPRNQVAKLDARFHAARQAAQQTLAGSAQRIRQARFDVLAAKLTLCEELERGAATDALVPPSPSAIDDLPVRWAAQAPLQPAWEQALALRWQHGQQGTPPAPPTPSADQGKAMDTVLLQLESALAVASPPEFLAARRDMKLLAMKAALEGRPSAGTANTSVDELMAAALAHPQPSTAQSERLRLIIAALREGN